MTDPMPAMLREAKSDMQKADLFIRQYLPFIKSEASKVMKKRADQSDDEVSIAMLGFHEAIKSYDERKGNFLSYATVIMRNRIIDFYRKEKWHAHVKSLDEPMDGDEESPAEQIADEYDRYEESVNLSAVKSEITHLSKTLLKYDLNLTDITENTPKQERTLSAARSVIQYAIDHKAILEQVEETGKLPITELARKTGVSKKTIERHRKYLVAMMIVQTNGFDMIRSHLKHVLILKGGDNK